MKRILLSSAAAAALLWATNATAQTSDQHQAMASSEKAETVIVTGRRLHEDSVPMKAVYTESTIGQETLLNLSPGPTTTIQTLLNSQPSILATTGGANGMETDIKFRSFVDGEFGETADGVPLNDIFNGGVTYQADNRNNNLYVARDLEGVDIYRGVNNPAVNTYNSLGGTINYRLRQPVDDMGGDVGVDGGSFGTLDYHVQFDTGELYGIKQTISFERDYSNSWHSFDPDFNDNLYWKAEADLGDTEVFSSFVYNRNWGDAPQYIPYNLIKQFGSSYQWLPSYYRSANGDTNFLGQIGFKSHLMGFITIEDEAYGGDNNYHRHSFSNPAYPGPYYLDDQGGYPFWNSYASPPLYDPSAAFPGNYALGDDYHFYGYNGALYGDRLQVTFDLPFNKVTAGGDYNIGELHSREYWWSSYYMPIVEGYNDAWDEHDTRQIFSGYIQDDIHFWDDRIHVTPGIKYIGSAVKDNDALGFYYVPSGSIHSDEHFLSPTIGASIEPLTDWTVYASFGKNVKFPDITALYNELGYGGAVPPVTVTPEYALDYEFGTRYKWKNFVAEINAYRENFSHIIYTFPVFGGFGATAQANGGEERYQGVEMQLSDDFGKFYVGNLKGYLNASYNEAVCTTNFPTIATGTGDAGNCTKGLEVANVPKYLMSTGLTWDGDGWHVNLEGRYVGTQHIDDYYTGVATDTTDIQPGQPKELPSYFLLNAGIVKVVPLEDSFGKAIRFGLNVDNILNKHYYTDGQSNTDTNNATIPTGSQAGNQYLDTYVLSGAGRAVYGSVSVYF